MIINRIHDDEGASWEVADEFADHETINKKLQSGEFVLVERFIRGKA
jgi:hypothetical protein